MLNNKSLYYYLITIISCIIFLITVNYLIKPTITLAKNKYYSFILKDSYDYSWKDNLTTNYNLNLYFMDTNGNYIEGRDVTFEIGPNNFKDDPYGFGYIPISGETTRGMNLIEELNLTEIASSTGEKYVFDHAEVYVDDTWQTFSSDSKHWDIWCQNSSSQNIKTDYGWRGKYGDEIVYTINETTEYKFVYKLIRLGQNESIPSLEADSGISFNIFNYNGDNTETGVNDNGLYDYFNFRGIGNAEDKNINTTLDEDGFTVNRAKVLPNLDTDGYPVFDCQGECINDTSISNTSLGYLFGSTTNPRGEATKGVTSYVPSNTLLQKETIDEVDYYYYDSARNAVDYDTENNRFMLRNYVERGYNLTTYENEANRYEFLPFNYLTDTTTKTNSLNNRPYNYETSELDHWYGMTMEFSFYMPRSGSINGKDMIFEFSGDDDVWVFIDNVLVLDLGGTHGAVDGSINFKTGEVESYLNWNGTVGTKNTTNIYQTFTNASAVDTVKWNSTDTTFANYTKHTLKFFYLERGASVANCKIRFNIPVLPNGSISVGKQFEGIDKYNDNYEFSLYDVTNNAPVINTEYTIGQNKYMTDETGKFTLKNTEVAIFQLTSNHTYYVEEVNTGAYATSYSCSLDGISCPDINKTPQFTINPESTYQAIFTNKVKTYDLKVSKIAYLSEENENFEFKLILKDENAYIVDILDDINDPISYNVDHEEGIVTFTLKNEESVIIKDIPINTAITLQETKHNGYQTTIKSGDILLSNTDTYEFILDSNKEITVYNTLGVTLPNTGGIGKIKYMSIGIILILISGLGYNYFFKSKEGER